MGTAIGSQIESPFLGSNWAAITDFGVVPNDSSPAVTAANRAAVMNRAFPSGKHLYWPGGVYYFDGTLYGLQQGVGMAGDPAFSTALNWVGNCAGDGFQLGLKSTPPNPDQWVPLGNLLDGSVAGLTMLHKNNTVTGVSAAQMNGLRTYSFSSALSPDRARATTFSCWSDPFSLCQPNYLWGGHSQYTVELAFRNNLAYPSAAVAAGATSLTFNTTAGLSAGDTLTFWDATKEVVTVYSVSGNTVTLTAALANAHAANIGVNCSNGVGLPNLYGVTGNPSTIFGLLGFGTYAEPYPWGAYLQADPTSGTILKVVVRGNDGNAYFAYQYNGFMNLAPGPGGLYRLCLQFDWSASPLKCQLWANGRYLGYNLNQPSGIPSTVTGFQNNEAGIAKLNVFNLTLAYRWPGQFCSLPDFTLCGLRMSTGLRYNNQVNSATVAVIDGGSGYSQASPPAVTFSAPTLAGGIQATGTAVVNASGQVIGITVTHPGSGYAGPDRVIPLTIAAPPGGGTTATGYALGQQLRTDTHTVPIDAWAYFGNDDHTMGFLPLLDGPNDAHPTEITIQIGGQVSGWVPGFLITDPGSTPGIEHSFLDLGFAAGGQGFGNAFNLMGGINVRFRNCKFVGSAVGLASGGGGDSTYIVHLERCYVSGNWAGYTGSSQTIRAYNFEVAGNACRVGILLLNCESQWRNVIGWSAGGRIYNFWASGDSSNIGAGDHLIDGWWDDSEGSSCTMAGFRCDLHANAPRSSFVLRNIKLDHVEGYANVVHLGAGPTSSPGYAIIEDVAANTSGPFFRVDSDLWYGDVRVPGGCFPSKWLHYNGRGKPNFRTVHDNLVAPPISGTWVAGGHLIQMKFPDANGKTRYLCTGSGAPGTWTGY